MTSHLRASLGRLLRDALLTMLAVPCGIAAGLGIGTLVIDAGLVTGTVAGTETDGSGSAALRSDDRADRVRALMMSHDCWTGSQAMLRGLRGELPGHVIATAAPTRREPDPRPTYSARMVGPALDQVFGTDPLPGLVVHAFCR